MLVAAHKLDVDSGSEQVYSIPLTRGYFALVDAIDYERIAAFKWHANVGVYQVRAARMSLRRMIYMQHQVLDMMPWALNGYEIDHVNRDPLDNTRDNLRILTHAQNMLNSKNAGKGIGVTYNERANLWMVYLDRPGEKRKYLGYTKTREEGLARVEAAKCV